MYKGKNILWYKLKKNSFWKANKFKCLFSTSKKKKKKKFSPINFSPFTECNSNYTVQLRTEK